ncbi:hypothetical protein AMECASPLE_024015 [Ameca splendens]|uniref:Uncharacterized protein n=1 Tax=Ameca splendens TaxID=208324 RepID=A0ABV1ADT7_9TELE
MDQVGGFSLPPPRGPRHKRTLFLPCKHRHLSFIWFAPNQQLRRQLSNLTSQATTLNLSTPGGSSNSNLLASPVLVPDYFPDK